MSHPTLPNLPAPARPSTGWPWTESPAVAAEAARPGGMLPRISIVTPSYNQGQFVEATLRSVLLQGYPNLEYIVMDGGSTDESVEIIKKYGAHLAYWTSERDRGQADAINRGLNRASGEILAWLNSDDILLPGALFAIADLYREHPQAVAWVGACHRVDPDGKILDTVVPNELHTAALAEWSDNIIYQPSVFFAARAWREAGPLDEGLHFAIDVDLWLKLSKRGEFVSTPQVLSAATIHKDAKTQAQRPGMFAELAVVQIRHGFEEIARRQLTRRLQAASSKNLVRGFLGQQRRRARRFLASRFARRQGQ